MKHLRLIIFALTFITIIGCEKDSEVNEPEFIEKYSLTGYLNGVYTEFTKNGAGECINNEAINDSVQICREVSFYNETDELVTITIARQWYVPSDKLLLNNEESNDNSAKFIPTFIQFDDFVNEFQLGNYKYSFMKDETYTSVTIGRENSTSYFSYNQSESDFSFIIDTIMVSEAQEMIYVAGSMNSVNSSDESELTNKVRLENMRFAYCLKNESIWYKNE